MSQVTAQKLKITCVIKSEELLSVDPGIGKPRVALRIKLPDRVISTDINAKSLRKVQATIRESGPENVACILQGALLGNDTVEAAGLSAQLKGAKREEKAA